MNKFQTKIEDSIKKLDNTDINAILKELSTKEQLKKDVFNVKRLITFLDLTTLEGNDTFEKVGVLCQKAIRSSENKDIPSVAAVCIYPRFIAKVKDLLKGTGIKTATVATSFPAGQVPLELKLAEVDYCIKQGADEVDMVISRGEFLSGNYELVYDEIFEISKLCKAGNVHLKVILETGELKTPGNIYAASKLAIEAGADFIKTSTGKINPAATLDAAYVMLTAIKEHFDSTGKKIGFKAAGGIRKTDEALAYASLVKNIVGDEWLKPELFRIGASSLLNDLVLSISN
ncbi:MAG: deoxyribose-phosphate aldolase [Ignavibacteria bacterium]|nr:deoxyribose-phosphate aldolase [Ignavibacteria bacterium]